MGNLDELFAENESLRGSCKAMGVDIGKLTRERNSFRAKVKNLEAENEKLRRNSERYLWIRDSDDAAPFLSEWGIGQGDGSLFEHVLDRVMRGEEPWNDIAVTASKEASHD